MCPLDTGPRVAPTRQRFPLDALALDETSADPLYRQLEVQLRSAILEGRLQLGERLPSTRRLADELGVARNTTVNAYKQLIVEGYVVTARGSGTRVARDLPEHLLAVRARRAVGPAKSSPLPLSRAARRITAFQPWIEGKIDRPSRPFQPHTPAIDAFPRELWAQLMTRRLRRSRSLLERADPRGYGPLRQVIATYLGSARGVSCDAEQVVITAGTQQAIELISRLLVEPGDRIGMEDPGYTPAKILFELAGAYVTSIPVDEQGLDVEQLNKSLPSAKLVYVTPSSQFPLGMTMSLPRRLALIEWAQRTNALILEDDYNGEYRYVGRPLPALHGLAPPGRVLYTSSFSKLLFPALRIGYVVVPPDAAGRFAAARWLVDRHSPPLEQAVLADFIDEGHFARHIRRMRTLYAERQSALVEAASQDLEGLLDVPALEAGLHLVGWLGDAISEAMLLEAASSANVDVTPTSSLAARKPKRASVILGYAPFSPREIRRATKALARACVRSSTVG